MHIRHLRLTATRLRLLIHLSFLTPTLQKPLPAVLSIPHVFQLLLGGEEENFKRPVVVIAAVSLLRHKYPISRAANRVLNKLSSSDTFIKYLIIPATVEHSVCVFVCECETVMV